MILTVKEFTRLGIKLLTGRFIYFFFSFDGKIKFWTDDKGNRIVLTKEELEEMHKQVKDFHVVAHAMHNR